MLPPHRSRPRRWALVLLGVLAGLALGACAPGVDAGDGPRDWRGLTLDVPDGWTVIEERTDLLSVSNEDLRPGDQAFEAPADPDSYEVVRAQFSADAGVSPDDYRELIAEQDGEIEVDARIEVGGLPATSITYVWASNGIPSRERVVFVPSRQLYVLLQPVPVEGQTNAREVYERYEDELDGLIGSIEFGRPFEG